MKKFKALLGMTVIAVTLLVIPFFSSCEKDYENDLSKNDYSKYLDIDVTSHIQFTSIEYEIMSEAFKRITNNVSYDGEQITPILSAQEMNMSERLFKYLYDEMSVNDDIVQSTVPLLKTKSETSHYVGVGVTITTVKLTRDETVDLMRAIMYCETAQDFIYSAIAASLLPAAGSAISAYTTLKAISSYEQIADYARSNSEGSTYTMTNIAVVGSPYWTTTHQFAY